MSMGLHFCGLRPQRSSAIILYYFPSEQKFKEFSSTFSRNSSFQGLFKHPWNLKLNSRAFQGLQGVALSLNERTEATQHWNWLKAENDFTQLYKAVTVSFNERVTLNSKFKSETKRCVSYTVAHNCHIKTKCAHQIQITHIQFKSLTANSNHSQQIQIAHSKLQIHHSK